MGSRLAVCLLCAGIPVLHVHAATTSSGQAWPTKPIRMLLPFPPGGGTDAVARMLSPRLSEATGQQWVIDNRGGAAGNIAAELAARSAPDGHTVLMGFSTLMTVNKSLYPKAQFDPVKDFSPVTHMAVSQYLLTVHPAVAAKSITDLVALAKAKPGALNYASAGVASPLHLSGELFRSRAAVNIVHIAYKGGGPAVAAVLAGEAQMVFGSVTASMPLVRAGKLRALAVTGLARSNLAPELPTLHESGFPSFNVTAWQSMVVPAGTPREIVTRMHGEIIKALATPEVTRLFHNIGYEITGTTPEKLADIIRDESRLWAQVIREAKIQPE